MGEAFMFAMGCFQPIPPVGGGGDDDDDDGGNPTPTPYNTPYITPTPTPDSDAPTPTPTPPADLCADYSPSDCEAYMIAEGKMHFGMATSVDDCIYNLGDTYCQTYFGTWVWLSDYYAPPECCCIWRCSNE